MASAGVAFLAICMDMVSSVAMATNHIVGDDSGWTVDFNYTEWAKDKVFRVGDNLVFNYDDNKHNVFKVDGADFKDCNNPPANEALDTGKDVISLGSTGRKWYICGVKNHCAERGMKLVINVQEAVSSSAVHNVLSSIYGVFLAAMVAVAAIFV